MNITRTMSAVLFAMLVWGSMASASVQAEEQQLQTISSWMQHLNYWFPDLEVDAAQDLSNPQTRQEMLTDLQKLEDYLHAGDNGLNEGDLKQLACGRPVCDGGDPNYAK